MIERETNPFQELYVTDSPDPRSFVHLFSDVPVTHTQFLFREGNVVLKGSQGSGKSMLLNLFRPSIRLAYAEANIEFPIPREMRKFLGAGINLTRSGAYDIGQRSMHLENESEGTLLPLYFADFVNYFIVRDIVESLSIISSASNSFDELVRTGHLDQFARLIAKDDCWFGWLTPCDDFETLKRKLDERIQEYRKFHNYNSPHLPENIHSTKSSIGEPIARTAEALKESGAIHDDTPVYIRIDELHRLYGSDVGRNELGVQYRRIINKALGLRDSRVSYRIGTRPYAWEDDLLIYGTSDSIEDKRDFQVVNLDDILQRRENKSTWIFPEFAADAFRRRLCHAGYKCDPKKDLIKSVFGEPSPAAEIARNYAGTGDPSKILKLPANWPEAWRVFLLRLFQESPLDACLAAAWVRQSGTRDNVGERLMLDPPTENPPWLKSTWRKERIRQCLLQIAARNQQRLKWSGGEQILSLSSGNITILLSISYEIWEAHLRRERRNASKDRFDPIRDDCPIHPNVQSLGIQEASDSWYRKISELPQGDDRQAFVDVMGRTFRTWLLGDDSMSNPGHNGFSIEDDGLNSFLGLRRFLRDAANYGSLNEVAHTTKDKNRKKRTKWYLSPILSPHFQIPESHSKEPKYIRNLRDIASWLHDAKIVNGDLQALLNLQTETDKRDLSGVSASQMTLELFPEQESDD